MGYGASRAGDTARFARKAFSFLSITNTRLPLYTAALVISICLLYWYLFNTVITQTGRLFCHSCNKQTSPHLLLLLPVYFTDDRFLNIQSHGNTHTTCQLTDVHDQVMLQKTTQKQQLNKKTPSLRLNSLPRPRSVEEAQREKKQPLGTARSASSSRRGRGTAALSAPRAPVPAAGHPRTHPQLRPPPGSALRSPRRGSHSRFRRASSAGPVPTGLTSRLRLHDPGRVGSTAVNVDRSGGSDGADRSRPAAAPAPLPSSPAESCAACRPGPALPRCREPGTTSVAEHDPTPPLSRVQSRAAESARRGCVGSGQSPGLFAVFR